MAGNNEDNTRLNLAHTQGSVYRDIIRDGAKLQVILAGSIESTLNTTITPLGSAETYTGTWERNELSEVMVSCKTDNTGTLYFDFSNDAVNVDTFPVNGFEVASGVHEFHVAVKGPRYFRARLVNDSGAQTYLRLYTYYGTFRQGNSPFNQTVSLDSDAIHVRPNDFQDEVRIGRRSGIAGWTKFAHRDGLTAANGDQVVWNNGVNTYTPASTADTFNIAYTGGGGANDGAGSTGALTLYFQYIDSDGLPASAVHTIGTDGTDTTSFAGYGINRVAVSSSGSADMNNAAITITHTTSTNVMGIIAANHSVTEQAIFHTGSNHDAVMKFLWMNCSKGGGGTPKVKIKCFIWNRMITTKFLVFEAFIDTGVETTISINEPIGFNLSPTDVIWFTADTDTNGAEIHIRFSLNEYQRT